MKLSYLFASLIGVFFVLTGACSVQSGTMTNSEGCGQGQALCGGTCVTTSSSSIHCGACNAACPNNTVCSRGECVLACSNGLMQCGNSCVDALNDADHCGGCNTPCEDGYSCISGSCTCADGSSSCGLMSGTGAASGSGGTSGGGSNNGAGGSQNDKTPSTGGSSSGGSNGGTGGSTNQSTADANFTVDVQLSEEIATVGIVTWSVDKTIQSAHIEFGRNAPEYEAPVDLTEPNYRTLLLGMKPDTTYTFRVVAEGEGQTYVSKDQTITTGFLPNALPPLDVTDSNASALYGGFTVSCNGVGNAGPGQTTSNGYAFIFDKDGEYVWAYELSETPVAECSRARMSHDGKHMWAGSFANTTSNDKGALRRISMDGLEHTDYTENPTTETNIQVANIARRHHDFSVLGNGNILYQERKSLNDDQTPDTIRELNIETGESTLIYDTETDFGYVGSHANYVTYIPSLNAVSTSLRHLNTIVLVSYPAGDVLGIFSGENDQFGVTWQVQHGHHFSGDNLVVFNNTNGGNANVLEFPFDLMNKTAGVLGLRGCAAPSQRQHFHHLFQRRTYGRSRCH